MACTMAMPVCARVDDPTGVAVAAATRGAPRTPGCVRETSSCRRAGRPVSASCLVPPCPSGAGAVCRLAPPCQHTLFPRTERQHRYFEAPTPVARVEALLQSLPLLHDVGLPGLLLLLSHTHDVFEAGDVFFACPRKCLALWLVLSNALGRELVRRCSYAGDGRVHSCVFHCFRHRRRRAWCHLCLRCT